MGRRRTRATDDQLIETAALAANGVSERDIAAQLGISWTTFKAWKGRDHRVVEALESGRGKEETALVGALFTAATRKDNPSIVAGIFLLKCRHGYIDQPKPQPQESRVEIKFALPGPLQPAQYKELIEATPTKALQEANVDAND